MTTIELTVSGFDCYNYSKTDIAYFFATRKILSTIIDTMSSIDYGNEYKIEPGYKIYLYNIPVDTFAINVWQPLSELLNLECGHIRCDSYVGCVKNCADVMIESKCVKN